MGKGATGAGIGTGAAATNPPHASQYIKGAPKKTKKKQKGRGIKENKDTIEHEWVHRSWLRWGRLTAWHYGSIASFARFRLSRFAICWNGKLERSLISGYNARHATPHKRNQNQHTCGGSTGKFGTAIIVVTLRMAAALT